MSLGSDIWVRFSQTLTTFADLTDVTLADEDTNSILTDNANRAFQGNVMNASGATWWPKFSTDSGGTTSGQNCNWCKERHLVAKFVINASGVPFSGHICILQPI